MAVYEFKCESCIRGYHIYKTYGAPLLDLICEREMLNSTDRYAVAVLKDDVISHLSRVLSRICSLFIARGGAITCVVNGARRYFLKED